MQNADKCLERMRRILREALPPQAFLRRDRGDALFVTNAPVFDPVIPSIPGFILIPAGKLLQILPDESWLAEIERQEAPDHLAASLLRFREIAPDNAGLRLFARGLKILDMGASAAANEAEAYGCDLRRMAALALRNAACGGGLYAAACILHLLNHQIQKKEYEI